MNKIYVAVIGLILFACSEQTTSEVSTGDFADAPAGAQRIPYPNNPNLVKVVQTGADGKVIQQGDYYDGLRNGVWTEYYPTGVIKTSSGYRNGKLHGTYLSADNRGQIVEKVDFIDGLKDGIYYKYDRGKVVHEMNYSNDAIQGLFRRYYSNGNLQEESNYSNGVLDGIAKWYDQQGNITLEYTYENGELVDKGGK